MTDRELERRANRRLAVLRHVEEVSGNVAATCRYYGISRQCYYGWLRRYETDGLDGLNLDPWIGSGDRVAARS
jgi:transposase-like protein